MHGISNPLQLDYVATQLVCHMPNVIVVIYNIVIIKCNEIVTITNAVSQIAAVLATIIHETWSVFKAPRQKQLLSAACELCSISL